MTPELLPLHLGDLHPYEQALAVLLAFGPFAVLAVVIAVRRHQDAADGSVRDVVESSAGLTPTR
jgi:hypothetical protein